MSKYVAKAALRQAKNYTKGYTDIQVKVREATSNDPWGPSGSQMTEVAEATYHAHEFMEIMDIIDKRLNDSGKNWRHVFKALTLLDYLIHCGSEQVIAYAKQNLYVIKTLKEFQFIDEEGRDQGLNVREKSKNIAALLSDDERLKDERQTRASLRDKMSTSNSVQSQFGNNDGFGASGVNSGYSSANPHQRKVSYAPSSAYEEQHQLERAIEESKRAAAVQDIRGRDEDRHERELSRVIEVSRQDGRQSSSSSFQQQQQQRQLPNSQSNHEIDLWGPSNDQKNHDLDFFTSMNAPAPVNAISPDPFGLTGTPYSAQPSFQQPPANQMNLFEPSSGSGYQQQQNYGGQQFGQQPFGQQTQMPFGQISSGHNQQQSFGNGGMISNQPTGSGQYFNNASAPPSGSGGFQANFDGAFDTGVGQRNLVPRHLQGQNPNAALAAVARNASQIDPFSNLAGSRGGSSKNSLTDLSFGGPAHPGSNNAGRNGAGFSTLHPTPASQASGGFPQQQRQQPQYQTSVFPGSSPPSQPKNAVNDPFASLSPFPAKSTQQAAPSLASQQSSVGFYGGSQQQQQPQQQMGYNGANNQQMMGGSMGMQVQQPQRPSQQQFGNNSNPFGQQPNTGFGQPQAQQQQQAQNNFFF